MSGVPTSYDTYGDRNADTRLGNFLAAQQPGVIIAIAGQDEYTNQLTDTNCRTQLQALGFSDKSIYGTAVGQLNKSQEEWMRQRILLVDAG